MNVDTGSCRRKEEDHLNSPFSLQHLQNHLIPGGQGEFILLASHLASTSWSCLQSCSRKPGAFQGTALSPERRETKQGLSPRNREQAAELTGSLSWSIVLTYSQLELLTWTKSDPSEVCVLFPPPLWLCPRSELGPWRLSSSFDLWRQPGQIMQPLPLSLSYSLGFTFLGSSLASAACLVH